MEKKTLQKKLKTSKIIHILIETKTTDIKKRKGIKDLYSLMLFFYRKEINKDGIQWKI